MGRWIGGAVTVGVLAGFVICCIMAVYEKIEFRQEVKEQGVLQPGSIVFGANTEAIPQETHEHEVPEAEAPVKEQNQSESAESELAQRVLDVTIRIRESRWTLEQSIGRFEELRHRSELAYATLSGYRDAIDRSPLYSENAESRSVLAWGGRLASQTSRLTVGIRDSVEDLRKLSEHEPYQQSRLIYQGACDFAAPRAIVPDRLPRNAQPVYEWFVRYARTMADVEQEWRAGLQPVYTALENMLAAELERAQHRCGDIECANMREKEAPK